MIFLFNLSLWLVPTSMCDLVTVFRLRVDQKFGGGEDEEWNALPSPPCLENACSQSGVREPGERGGCGWPAVASVCPHPPAILTPVPPHPHHPDPSTSWCSLLSIKHSWFSTNSTTHEGVRTSRAEGGWLLGPIAANPPGAISVGQASSRYLLHILSCEIPRVRPVVVSVLQTRRLNWVTKLFVLDSTQNTAEA